MPILKYDIGIIDLTLSVESQWKRIQSRNEIRKAQKTGVYVEQSNGLNHGTYIDCRSILKKLLKNRQVPYDVSFDEILLDSKNLHLVARTSRGDIASFIVISFREEKNNEQIKKVAVLKLSATDKKYVQLSPNYLLIWEAIIKLSVMKIDEFNIGLLTYQNSPDPDLEGVAFFKRKWITHIQTAKETVFVCKYVYIRYIKRFKLVKIVVYYIKLFVDFFCRINHFFR